MVRSGNSSNKCFLSLSLSLKKERNCLTISLFCVVQKYDNYWSARVVRCNVTFTRDISLGQIRPTLVAQRYTSNFLSVNTLRKIDIAIFDLSLNKRAIHTGHHMASHRPPPLLWKRKRYFVYMQSLPP